MTQTFQTRSAKPSTAKRTSAKTYIDVAYQDRDLAKRLGARWDASVKRWYCPAGSTLALIYKWRKAPTPAELAAPEVQAVTREVVTETRMVDVASAPKPTTKVVAARISRMPTRRASAPVCNDLFAEMELPLAG